MLIYELFSEEFLENIANSKNELSKVQRFKKLGGVPATKTALTACYPLTL